MTTIPSLHFSDDDGSRPMARNEIDGETNVTVIYRQNLRLHNLTDTHQRVGSGRPGIRPLLMINTGDVL